MKLKSLVIGLGIAGLSVLSLEFGFQSNASAATITSLVGDKDCFGLGSSCPDGTLYRDQLGGGFFQDYRTPSDPSFTDRWLGDIGISYTYAYNLGGLTPTSAELEIKTAGLADDRGPWNVFFNSVNIGQFLTRSTPNDFQEVVTHNFAIPVNLLTQLDGIRFDINIPNQGDGYIIDYSELRISTSEEVPEPSSTLGIFVLGAIGAGAALKRKQNKAAIKA